MKRLQNLSASIAAGVAVLGLGVLVFGLQEADSAPKEAALAAVVLAAVIPFYIVARCIEMAANAQR